MFEDQPGLVFRQGLMEQLEGHELVAKAGRLGEAFDVLKSMALGNLKVDVILLDANLDEDSVEPIFTHQLPIDESKAKTNWRGKVKLPAPEMVVVRGWDYLGTKTSAHAVVDIMQRTGLTAKLIGISGDPMSKYGLEGAMHTDLTKWGIAKLGSVLSSIEQADSQIL